jgi:hypothetical protein
MSASDGPNEPGLTPQSDAFAIDGCFPLEPFGRIYLSFCFTEQALDRKPFDVSLCWGEVIREKNSYVVERCGHRLSLQRF